MSGCCIIPASVHHAKARHNRLPQTWLCLFSHFKLSQNSKPSNRKEWRLWHPILHVSRFHVGWWGRTKFCKSCGDCHRTKICQVLFNNSPWLWLYKSIEIMLNPYYCCLNQLKIPIVDGLNHLKSQHHIFSWWNPSCWWLKYDLNHLKSHQITLNRNFWYLDQRKIPTVDGFLIPLFSPSERHLPRVAGNLIFAAWLLGSTALYAAATLARPRTEWGGLEISMAKPKEMSRVALMGFKYD